MLFNTAIFVILVYASTLALAQDEASSEIPVFTEVQDQVGIFSTGTMGQSAVWGDFDGDGWQDLLVTNNDRDVRSRSLRRSRKVRSGPAVRKYFQKTESKKLFLFKNEYGEKFSDVAFISGLPNTKIKAATWADYDGDGYADLAIAPTRAAIPPLLYKNQGGLSFVNVSEEAGWTRTGSSIRHVIWTDYDRDGNLDLFAAGNQLSHLYRNKGDGTFEEVSELAGVSTPNNSQAALFFDSNNNGWPDLFVANGGYNMFYINNGDGTFTDASESSGLAGAAFWQTSGSCAGDYNGDGYLDLYITNIGKAKKNALYRNNGDGTFTDVTWSTGTQDVGDGRTCAWIDFDADGRLDLFTTNHIPTSKLFRNLGNGVFKNVALEVGVAKPLDVFAATWADYDRDGFLDVYLNGHMGNTLKRNQGNSNKSLTLHLVGDGLFTNYSAIGARAILTTPAGQQIREVSGGRGGIEQDMLPLHFGLGAYEKADIKILWPSGKECSFSGVSAIDTHEYRIAESKCDIIAIENPGK